MKNLFSESELGRIQEAIAEAEQRTAGEIVPYVVSQSDSYDVAVWRGIAAGGLTALFTALMVFQFYQGWGLDWLHQGWGMALFTLILGMVGGGLGRYVPPVRRQLAGADMLAEKVHARALQAFLEEEVFDTRDRTGILLFISLFEHRIEVVGDSGINQQVDSDDWVHIVEHIRDGIKQDRLADGLIEAVEMCGHLLEKRGVEIRPDDTNELSDSVRLRKE